MAMRTERRCCSPCRDRHPNESERHATSDVSEEFYGGVEEVDRQIEAQDATTSLAFLISARVSRSSVAARERRAERDVERVECSLFVAEVEDQQLPGRVELRRGPLQLPDTASLDGNRKTIVTDAATEVAERLLALVRVRRDPHTIDEHRPAVPRQDGERTITPRRTLTN